MTDTKKLIDSLDCLVDLHLHIDGAISVANAKDTAAKQGIAVPDDETLRRMMTVEPSCGSLGEFLGKFAFPCSLLKSEIGIRTAVANLLAELKDEGLMYAELRFAPALSANGDFTVSDAVSAALDGMKSAEIPSSLILCLIRGETDDKNRETVRVAGEYLGHGVVAVDLAGDEAKHKTADYADLFAYAKSLGVPCIAHAGEADGADSVKSALGFGVRRIGHGIRSVDDEAVLDELVSSGVTLEICPTSNVQTNTVKSYADLPIETFRRHGVNFTVNTDDPAIEGTSLKEEYRHLVNTFGWGKADIRGALLASVDASFADDGLKRSMRERIENELG